MGFPHNLKVAFNNCLDLKSTYIDDKVKPRVVMALLVNMPPKNIEY